MVGIVIVSHSHLLARGVEELVRGMTHEKVPLAAVGGLDEPDHPLGTDAVAVREAIERVSSGDGVLVLMDLGSAVLSAEMALDMLPESQRERVLLCEAPLVEGAMSAAVQAGLGAGLEEVAAEARGALVPKAEHLGTSAPSPSRERVGEGVAGQSVTLTITNPLGLHARPAVRFVETVGRFDAQVSVRNVTTGKGPAKGRSLNALATLGVRQGHEIGVEAHGPQANEVLEALEALAAEGFGEAELREGVLTGLAASPGIAFGEARRFRPPAIEVPTYRASDPHAEWEALQVSLEEVQEEIGVTREAVRARAGDYQAAIFDAHLLFLGDEQLLAPAHRLVYEEGLNAAAAWDQAVQSVVEDYQALDDEYLQARAQDLQGVSRQVLLRLLDEEAGPPDLRSPGILVAPDLTPAETVGLDAELVQGIATAHGSPTSHSAILARSLGVPAVVGLGQQLLELPQGTPLVLDGDEGVLHPTPSAELRAEYQERARLVEERRSAVRAAAHRPAVTRDGRRVEVAANLGSTEEVGEALAQGAEGVGLLRTEFLFLDRDSMPSEEEQYQAYLAVAEALGGRPFILRTLDVGGDKPLPHLGQGEEANPFLGRRGIRLSLAAPEAFRLQIRAALRVAARHPLKVMFPMVSTLRELRLAKELVERSREELDERAPSPLEVGVMVEVPSLALMADRFAHEVDFFSLGTNDLTQYVMAAERGNSRVAELADHLHPAVLRLIRRVVEAAEAAGKWVGVCGEMAADRSAVPLLVGLGISELSMAPQAIPFVKEKVRELSFAEAGRLSEKALGMESAEAVRELLG